MLRKESDDLSSLAFFAKLDTLLNDVARELVLGEIVNVLNDSFDHDGAVLFLAVLNDVLNDIIAELVRNQRFKQQQ